MTDPADKHERDQRVAAAVAVLIAEITATPDEGETIARQIDEQEVVLFVHADGVGVHRIPGVLMAVINPEGAVDVWRREIVDDFHIWPSNSVPDDDDDSVPE